MAWLIGPVVQDNLEQLDQQTDRVETCRDFKTTTHFVPWRGHLEPLSSHRLVHFRRGGPPAAPGLCVRTL